MLIPEFVLRANTRTVLADPVEAHSLPARELRSGWYELGIVLLLLPLLWGRTALGEDCLIDRMV